MTKPKHHPKRKVLDTKGYYKILRVSPEAGADDLLLAYAMVKQSAAGLYLKRVEAAYAALKSPERRAAYDAEGLERKFEFLKSPITLVVAILVLIGVFKVMWLPKIRIHNKTFEAGQTLVKTSNGQEFGTVIRVEPSHRFATGASTRAYLVEMAAGHKQVWLPAIDLQATCDGK